ncbi:uncharacterized protein LOC135080795 [Ostrinia nubilalis]|uniref:uncharacterized protein LOC135080795 n=1 Tax=Ostrinia nubilalis TaxID=29057 RepID=UPI0030823D2F
MKPLVFSIVAAVLIGSISCSWRDPTEPRALAVTGNHTGAGAADVVQLLCEASGIANYTTLHWVQQQGDVQHTTWRRGPSPLALALPAAQAHGSAYFCTAPFTEFGVPYTTYTVRSELTEVSVAGAGAPSFPARPGRVELTSSGGDTHRVGDLVTYTCTAHDFRSTVMDVVQAKDQYEIQLHTGWQPTRVLTLNVTAADHGSALYCRVTSTDPDDRTLYTLVSRRLPLYVTAG